MQEMCRILETARMVAEMSTLVRIDGHALVHLCKQLYRDRIAVPPWNDRYHYKGGDQDTVAYLLVVDTLNFCFWAAKGTAKWEIDYESETLSGYYALAASLKQAIESGFPVANAQYLAQLSSDGLRKILGGRGELQLFEDRVHILNDLGRVLIKDYDGDACNLVAAAGKSAVRLARLVAEHLISFRDVAEYRGYTVFFYKRAQIFAADLYGAFGGREWGWFTDIDKLTIFADYKLPQLLRHLGILHYAESLSEKVDHGILLESGSPEEVEIRANTVWAVELMRRELGRMGMTLRAFEIDWILWNMSQDTMSSVKPYHKTLSVFY